MPFIAIALLVAAALGGGTSVAAQSALPGDALWGFKVNVNERVGETLAVGGKAKADWDIALVSARLDEAAQLAAHGKLDANAQADINGNFDAHARDVAARVATLQAEGNFAAAADVAARFQATVAHRASVLTQASTNANAHAQAGLGVVLSRVRATLDAASTLSADASAKAAAQGSSTSAGSTNSGETNVKVQTGTSVNGGQGGIKVDSTTGAKVGI